MLARFKNSMELAGHRTFFTNRTRAYLVKYGAVYYLVDVLEEPSFFTYRAGGVNGQ